MFSSDLCCLYANIWCFSPVVTLPKVLGFFQYCEEKITKPYGYLIEKGWSEEFSAASPEGSLSLEATALKL